MLKLTTKEKNRAKSLFLDMCICSGLVPNSREESYYSSRRSLLNSDWTSGKSAVAGARRIIQIITKREPKFDTLGLCIKEVCNVDPCFGDTPDSTTLDYVIRVDHFVEYLAYMCAELKFYWDNTIWGKEEFEAKLADTSDAMTSFIMKTFYDAELFVTQHPKKATTTRTRSAGTPSAPGTGPKLGYKAAGPQSGNVVGLIGTPGEKKHLSGEVYFIKGAKSGTITPNANIAPVTNKDLGIYAQLSSAGVPRIKFSAGNGYTDLTIYSPDLEQITKIYKLLEERGVFSKYSDVQIVRTKASATGYFEVETEAGSVFVKPTKLNEKLLAEAVQYFAEDLDSGLKCGLNAYGDLFMGDDETGTNWADTPENRYKLAKAWKSGTRKDLNIELPSGDAIVESIFKDKDFPEDVIGIKDIDAWVDTPNSWD